MDFSKFISELGIDKLPMEQQHSIFEDALKTLQLRMSLRMSETLSEDQMKALEDATARSEVEGRELLEKICPNYEQMYQEELETLTQELKM